MLKYLILLSIFCLCYGQKYNSNTTPVPILKQINKHNEDGSYSYGYEGADGSFKIETKYANGEVYGKYGYVDDSGKLREVEYGASNRGFEPQGHDINVPPPTLTKNEKISPLGPNEIDDGQYREDPSIYYNSKGAKKQSVFPSQKFTVTSSRPILKSNYQPQQHQQQYYQQPTQQTYFSQTQQNYNQFQQQQPIQYQQHYPQQHQQQQQQQQYYQPQQYQPNQYYQQQFDLFRGHPAENIDINTGSYSVTYTG